MENETTKLLTSALAANQTEPEEAAQNIERSKFYEVSPDTYKGLKTQLDPEITAIERIPAQVGNVTEDYLRQSEQHLALAKDDVGFLANMEKRLNFYKQQIFEVPELNREINALTNKKITEGSLSQGEEEMLQNLNLSMAEISEERPEEIGNLEGFGVDIASATGDFIRSYWENKELLAGSIAGGAAIGAGVGAVFAGVGAGPGALAGGIKGAVGASVAIGFLDGYSQMRGSVYNELSLAVDDKGNPLNIPHERMANTAMGVGAISGIASAAASKVLTSNNPLLKRFLSPKTASKLLTSNPALMAKMEVLGGMVNSIVAEGGAEGLSELTNIFGQEFAKTDESEASFMNALDNTLTSENLQRVAYSAAVGGGTGGAISSVSAVPGYVNLKSQYETFQGIEQERQTVLNTQNTMLELANDIKQTKMNKLSPAEMGNFKKQLFSAVGIDENVFFTIESLREFSNTPEKGDLIRKKIDPNGEMTRMAQELNTPIEMSKADLLDIVLEFPEVTDIMRTTPDGESPADIRNDKRTFSERLDQAQSRQTEILDSLEADQELTDVDKEQLRKALDPVRDSRHFTNEADYLDSVTFTENSILSAKEAEALNTTHLDARLEVARVLREDVDSEYQAIENRIFRDVNSKDIQNDLNKLDTEFKILERFTDRKNTSEAGMAAVQSHTRKGFSPSAIDPRSLPEDLRATFLEDPILKRRKVFVNGGLNIEESAALNGVSSGAELLRILANTPSRNQVIKNREQRKIELRNRINQTIKPSKLLDRDKAFENLTRLHVKEMEYMRSKEWPTLKRGIIKLAGQTPSVESLNQKAKADIGRSRIRDLNANRFKVGERKSQNEAMKGFLKGEFEAAYANKEKAALNNEFRRETIKAQDKVALNERFWKRANKPSVQQELKDAGYLEAMNDFMSAYKLEGRIPNESEQNSFNKWVRQQEDRGEYVPVIPDRLTNTQASFKDLTVDQYQEITDMGRTILHQAKLKNKLLKQSEARAEFRTAEMIGEEIAQATQSNIKFDAENMERENARYLSFTENIKNKFETSLSAVSSVKTIVSELDDYKFNGLFHRLIGEPIKNARTAKRDEIGRIEAHDRKIIETIYGMDEFKKMFNEFVDIPEFNDIPTLGDGEGAIRKVDLLVLQAYMGDPEGRQAMTNFMTRDGRRLTIPEVQTVLDRVLTEKDAAFVQNFMVDRFKQFEQRSFDLQMRTLGVEPDMVKGEQVIHKGKVLPGGYYPIKRQIMPDEVKAAKYFENLKESVGELTGTDEKAFFSRMRAAEMTQQGRLKDRTGSDRPLDITFENVFDFTEEAVHDLNFREVGIDVLKVLKNPINVQNMKGVIGPKKFTALLNGVKDVVSKTTERESTLFGEEYQFVNNIIQKAHSLHAVKAIGLNLTSAAIQVDSLPNLMLRLGPKTGLYLSKTAAKITANLKNYQEYVDLASEINPDIRFEKDGIDSSIIKESYDFIPASNTFLKNYKNSSAQAFSRIREVQRKAVDASFYLVRQADRYNKVVATMAVSEQFLNGDIEGFPIEKVQAMSEAERAKTMRSVVQQAIDLTQTSSAPEDKTALEKNPVAKIFTRYWTDRRARLTSTLALVDKAKGQYKKGQYGQVAASIGTLALASGVSAAYVGLIRQNEDSIWEELKKVKDPDDVADFALDMAWNFAKAPIEQTLDVIPIVDNIKYQTELDIKSDYRNVSTPLFGVASDVAMGVVALKDVLGGVNSSIRSMIKKGELESPFRRVNLSNVQQKSLLTNMGYLIGGAPTNGMNKALEALQSREVRRGSKFVANEIQQLNKEIKVFTDMFRDVPEAQQFIDDLKEYQQTLPQDEKSIKNIIPENAKEVIKGNTPWNKIDPETGAAGIYQFTEERWNEIMTLNPELGLTENGRVAKSPAQQEKAMQWELEDNARSLMAFQVPVNNETLFGAHKFGFDNFVAIYTAKDSEKLTDLIGEEVNSPVFKNLQTVRSVKNYVKNFN